jgi:trans-2,3-dihydro-3-hydroxyanthranilate isomerase
MKLAYEIWDVFTDKPLQGNPLALIPDATQLNNAHMQAIAREFNLSETSFILPSEKADVRARYFTPSRELPMAGHPTIGTTFALHRHGKMKGESFRLELNAGVFDIRLEYEQTKLTRAWMNQGVPKEISEISDKSIVAKALNLDNADVIDLPIEFVSAGNPFLMVPVTSLDALSKARLNPSVFENANGLHVVGVFVFTTATTDVKVRGRMFASGSISVSEDPATGSAHGPLGWYMATHGLLEFQNDAAQFVSHQGVEMGRSSELHVHVTKTENNFSVSVGGHAVLVAEGILHL